MSRHPFTWRHVVRKVLSFVFSRLVVTGVLLLVQIVWLFLLFNRLSEYAAWINGVGLTVSVIMCLALIRKDSTVPEFKISWLILFTIMPVQGGLLYLLWGDKRPAIRLRRRMERAEERFAPLRTADPAAQAALEARDPRPPRPPAMCGTSPRRRSSGTPPPSTTPAARRCSPTCCPPCRGRNRASMWRASSSAWGRCGGRSMRSCARKPPPGLDVRVIYDDAGCLSLLPHNYDETLQAEGIRAFSFNRCVPLLNLVMNNRDHRKIMVIDGRIAFTGGVNLADEYINKLVRFGYWKDSGVRLEGPAARSFANIFLTFWQAHYPKEEIDFAALPAAAPVASDSLVQPFADSPVDRESVAKNVYLDLISQAQKRLYICTPYLILDNDLLSALRLAAKRGVDVRIYTPGIPDKPTIYLLTRSYFPSLLQAGVKIYRYVRGSSTPRPAVRRPGGRRGHRQPGLPQPLPPLRVQRPALRRQGAGGYPRRLRRHRGGVRTGGTGGLPHRLPGHFAQRHPAVAGAPLLTISIDLITGLLCGSPVFCIDNLRLLD